MPIVLRILIVEIIKNIIKKIRKKFWSCEIAQSMFETASIGACKIELLGSLNKLYLMNIKFNIFPATTAFTNLKVKLNTH